MANSVVWAEEWTLRLQDRLNLPTNWREVCEVVFTNTRVLHRPYETLPSVTTSATRGSAYTYGDITSTDDSVTISTYDHSAMLIDRADMAQQTFYSQMVMAERQGRLLSERLETAMLADHANWTDFGTSDINAGGSSTSAITVSTSNIDDIIRNVLREIRDANAQDFLLANGAFIVWRPSDFEKLEQLMQSNGFNAADQALRNGASVGVSYMGVTHYVSTSHASGHLMGGLRKALTLGIVRSTWGQVVVVDEPSTGGGNISGIGVVSRVDYAFNVFNNLSTTILDINVA